ncbi:PREDICTED: GEM-like protein 4 [Populus euphratica]|uniref:GEM-like protein 4 n=1 Tax=Populus euphratica TaxID=75702 RepID=A0AAJ6U3H5_POPEU|nr:PREDICTED: GEM-like protein 4 [Populus euphratica]
MNNTFQDQVIGIPINSGKFTVRRSALRYLPGPDGQYPPALKKTKKDSILERMNKLGRKADNFANGVREHVRLGSKITETVKGKLSLGAKILQEGGVEKTFKRLFVVSEDEKLLKVSQSYLSTTAGPLAGLLFISNQKLAFCSERAIKFSSPNGKSVRVHYKVVIPLRKIKRVSQSENVKKPSQKYMQIVTVDDFDFWFMGFFNHQKTFKYLELAISQISDELHVTLVT